PPTPRPARVAGIKQTVAVVVAPDRISHRVGADQPGTDCLILEVSRAGITVTDWYQIWRGMGQREHRSLSGCRIRVRIERGVSAGRPLGEPAMRGQARELKAIPA